MCLLIRVPGCTHKVHLSRLKLMHSRLLWLEHRPTFSAALRRTRQSSGLKSSLHPNLAFPVWAPRPYITVLPRSPLTGVPVLCAHSRTLARTPVAFASSSAASTPSPAGSVKTQADTERSQAPTTVPLEDVKRILRLAHPERGRLAAAIGFLTVSSAVTMSAPFFLGRVIDTIYASASDTETMTASLTSLCIMLAGVFLCGGACNAARVYLMQSSGQQIVRNLRASVFSSILRQEVAFFDKNRTGELINRLSADTAVVGRSITDNLSDGLRAVAQAAAGVSMMFYVSPSLASFVLLIVPPMAGLAVIYGRYLRSISKRTQDALAQATQLAEERISNMRTVRAFGKELSEVDKYTQKTDHVLGLAKKEAVMRAGFFGVRKEAPIFQNLNLLVPAGSIMAVVGASGSGKSSMVSLLLRLYDPDAGVITIDGHDIRDLNPYWLRSRIGTVSQEPVLFSCSIRENIAYGATDPDAVTTEDVYRAAKVANAYDFIQTFPKGFDTVVGEKGVLLSGGQKQRIAIARALLKNPKILLLDEATSALDAENEFLVQEALERLMEGRTVVIIAHRLSTIKNADAVAVLDQRRIAECGQPTELLGNRQGLFRKLMEKQAFLQEEQQRALI
ncbi:ATP-binding cassette sub-family B member 10, mitochondrial [Pundamilia nyererei]|uniref:ATP-binding cassette sub-family B member 10, mitochondrial n=1 Tax=Pundamilia nyererei TaxID=303518 RepID=A0A9Y3R6Z1_9CICH|nr:PREDICTED: ATP-binding cassette sub-family B member 10, mitochondrial [Pundamilia nyererei]